MNTNRKIQLAAAAVIVNGALALMFSTPAFASICNDVYEKCAFGGCPGNCPSIDPHNPSCNLLLDNGACNAPVSGGDCPGDYTRLCTYTNRN
jgi:hypothetical protein